MTTVWLILVVALDVILAGLAVHYFWRREGIDPDQQYTEYRNVETDWDQTLMDGLDDEGPWEEEDPYSKPRLVQPAPHRPRKRRKHGRRNGPRTWH